MGEMDAKGSSPGMHDNMIYAWHSALHRTAMRLASIRMVNVVKKYNNNAGKTIVGMVLEIGYADYRIAEIRICKNDS